MVNVLTFENCNIKYIQSSPDGKYAIIAYDAVDHNGTEVTLTFPNVVLPKEDLITVQCDENKAFMRSSLGVHYLESDGLCRFSMMPKPRRIHKMTLSEIEKKLGYKIELVDEEDSRK